MACPRQLKVGARGTVEDSMCGSMVDIQSAAAEIR